MFLGFCNVERSPLLRKVVLTFEVFGVSVVLGSVA